MNKDQALSIVRAILNMAGMWLLKNGYTDNNGMESIAGLAPIVVALAWGWFHHGDKNQPSGTSMSFLLAFFLPVLLGGCATQGVPETKFVVKDPVTGSQITYEGPKQVRMDELTTSLTKPDGTAFRLSLKGLSATNEPDVVATAGEADAKRIAATAGLVSAIGNTVGQAAAAAAKATVAAP